jgi:hypothetical protein
MSVLYHEVKKHWSEQYDIYNRVEVLAEFFVSENEQAIRVITVDVATNKHEWGDNNPNDNFINSKLFNGTDQECIREAIKVFDALLDNHPNKDKLR